MSGLITNSAGVRGFGASAEIKQTDLSIDFSTTSTDILLFEDLWIPGIDFFRNGYLVVEAYVSARCTASGIGRFGVSIGAGFFGWMGLSGATATRGQGAAVKAVSSPILVGASGMIAVGLRVGRINAPGPATFNLPVLSDGSDTMARLISRFVVDNRVVPP